MKGLSFSSLRSGQLYCLKNFGEEFYFKVDKILSNDEFILKDINTLETYRMSELTQFGKGKDFEIQELIDHTR